MSSVLDPFIERLRSHPGFASADRELIAEAEAHPVYCLASIQHLEKLLRCRHVSRAPAQQLNVYGSSIGLRQRRTLFCRSALCALLISRLMRLQGQYRVRNMQHHACCVISRRHFLVSKNAAETLFQEGQRLYGVKQYSKAAKSWSQAALLGNRSAHAFLSNLLFEGRQDVPKDEQRAFEFASGGAALGCVHSKGALARCLLKQLGIPNPNRDDDICLALAKESAESDSPFGMYVLAMCYREGLGVSKDDNMAMCLFKQAAKAGHPVSMCELAHMLGKMGPYPDYPQIVSLLYNAAEQGHALAQCNLGLMYKHGIYFAVDNIQAMKYFLLAAEQDCSIGKGLLQIISRKLSKQK